MKKLDVLLINPGSRPAQYQGLGDEFGAIEPPSLAAMFATYLTLKGLSVEMIDQPAENLNHIEVATRANAANATLTVLVVYGFQPSASTQNMPAASAIAAQMKAFNPTQKIMMTGTHPAALPERTLAEEAIDYVCSGEGPMAIYMAAIGLLAKVEVPRIISGENLAHVDHEMPYGAWGLLPMDKYRAHNWHAFESIDKRQPYVSMHTSLGCPFKCTFCCINAPFGGPGYRMWSPLTVVNELWTLRERWGVRHVKFVDEMFVLNREHVNGICDLIIERGLGEELNIWAYARVDTVKDEYLDRLRRAGVRWLALGIESASKHVRDGVEKGRFGSEAILQTVSRIQAAGINVIGNYIFGLPDDTAESMRATLDLALEANCEFANFYSAMAYPGSKLYKLALEKGWKLPDSWSGYSQHSYDTEPLPTETLTGAEVLCFRDYAFKAYFRSEPYLSAVKQKFGQPVVDHIERMVAQPLKRRLLHG